jgi:hypothetical protein
MNIHSITYSSVAMLIALAIGIMILPTNSEMMESSYAQSTTDIPSSPDNTPDSSSPASDDGESFQQFMECLFGGEASDEDISSALEGSGDSTPTEQEIRDCFAPLYNTGGASDTTTPAGGGSTDDGGSTGDSGETDESSEDQNEDASSDGETPE